jgi:AcrR family transcriptional regulator
MMAERKRSPRSKKRERILEKATELFIKHGIKRVTVAEICREAGASKMTFYKYFDNKIELLRHIWQKWFDLGYARLAEIDAMDIAFKEKMGLLIEYKMGLVEEMSPRFISEVLHAAPELAGFVTEMTNKNISLFMEFVEKAQERGDMRRMRTEFFMAAMGKMQELLADRELERSYPDGLDFMREVLNFLFFGILPAPGDQD